MTPSQCGLKLQSDSEQKTAEQQQNHNNNNKQNLTTNILKKMEKNYQNEN